MKPIDYQQLYERVKETEQLLIKWQRKMTQIVIIFALSMQTNWSLVSRTSAWDPDQNDQ